MKAVDFIQSEGIARATRIVKAAPQWAVYYDAKKRCYDDIRCESSVSLTELEEVLVGYGE
ncbi:hypothetical protein [Acinetobacter pollinis]|uniref:hypothetical protein n=1 Tax=Acinetobacter pollinis TaxID=2605270 RepID=UPI0018A24A5F|nr:hypothetical protein [Acinetobacter pollinis]MBF7691757.1 hypothetical protein [Acinetobacter pollinis]MBF7699376.1 hypothetical protein [Acinetobacter pollinis]